MEPDTENSQMTQPTISHTRIKIVFGVLVCLVILSIIGAVYFYLQTKKSGDMTKADAIVSSELQKTIEQVSKLIVLPTDEQPTMATVSDPDKLAAN